VIHVEDEGALDLAARYAPFVHAFLLDSGRPGAAVAELGGTGRVHDWEISRQLVRRSARPVFLAGGLGPHNVADAIASVGAYGHDVCSGVRTAGALDAAKLAALVSAARAVE
jgi:phosphoribosylanthranilate isomerase